MKYILVLLLFPVIASAQVNQERRYEDSVRRYMLMEKSLKPGTPFVATAPVMISQHRYVDSLWKYTSLAPRGFAHAIGDMRRWADSTVRLEPKRRDAILRKYKIKP